MKKSFFKKLSFVLALAMIVSVIAPAAGVFAASKPAVNTSKKYLFLGETGKNEYDFNIKNKVKGSTYTWTSSDKKVATVNKKTGYTTAVATGKTTVKCTIKVAKKTYTVKASVIVKDNIKTLTIANKPAGDKLAVDAANAFSTTFTTCGGSTAKTTAVVKWAVTDKDGKATTGAAITDKGEFKATVAGTYKVVAAAFQSNAKFESWKTTQNQKLVLATDTATVTVAPSITAVKQFNTTKFTVTFDTDMSKSDIATKASVYKVIAGQRISSGAEKIKTVTYDTTGKIATIEMYAAFDSATEYNFVYGDLTGKFTSAEVALANIKSIEMTDATVYTTATAGTSIAANVVAKNADGVIIYTGEDSAFANYLTYAVNGDQTKLFIGGSGTGVVAYCSTVGYASTITVTYTNSILNSTTNKYESVSLKATGNVIAAKPDTDVNTSTMQYYLGTSAPTSTSTWTNTSFNIAAGDTTQIIYTRYKLNNATSTTDYSTDSIASVFSYTSSDNSVAITNGAKITAIKAGTVTVVVKNVSTSKVVGTFNVTIGASRTFVNVEMADYSTTVGNNATYGETGTVTAYAKDSQGDSFAPSSIVFTPSNAGISCSYSVEAYTNKISLNATAHGVPAGSYAVKVAFTGKDTTINRTFTLVVGESNTTATQVLAGYSVVLSKTSVDVKEASALNDATIAVYGVNAAGYRFSQLNDSQFTVAATYNGSAVTPSSIITEGALATTSTGSSIAIVRAGSAAGTFVPLTKGTYTISATTTGVTVPGKTINTILGYAALVINDTTTATYTPGNLVVSKAAHPTIDSAVKSAFTFYLNGYNVTSTEGFSKGMYIVSYKTSDGSAVAATTPGTAEVKNGSLSVTEVTVRYLGVDYTIAVGQTLTITD